MQQAKKHGIKVSMFRADSASYNKNIMSYMNDEGIEFFIRQRSSKDIRDKLKWEVENWKDGHWKGRKCEFGSFQYQMNGSENTFRVAVKRMFDNGKYNHSCIVTNNTKWSNEKVMLFYAKRGAEEKRFAEIKNEFNFMRCPFSFLDENTAFWLISSIAYNVYKHILSIFRKNNSNLKENSWLRVFRKVIIFHVIIIFENSTYQVFNACEKTLKLFRKFWEDF